MQSKWHNISIKTESFKELQQIQKQIPIRVSIPQTIEWLIDVGQKQINKELLNDNTRRIHKP
jgi:phosphoenolpyruvate synthase/pyruvate phosphate dikinase|tara:strand:- start:870 stop:1055 length:186 start_codon:yes stop_codon:yes gene_type:complete